MSFYIWFANPERFDSFQLALVRRDAKAKHRPTLDLPPDPGAAEPLGRDERLERSRSLLIDVDQQSSVRCRNASHVWQERVDAGCCLWPRVQVAVEDLDDVVSAG